MSSGALSCQVPEPGLGNSSNSRTAARHPECYSPRTGVYRSVHPPRALPVDPFLDAATFVLSHCHRGSVAVVDAASGSSISYAELLPLVHSIAVGIAGAGVAKGDVVLLLLGNCIFYPVVFLGVLRSGAVATTMSPFSSEAEIRKRLRECNPRLAFATPQKSRKLRSWGVSTIEVPENLDSREGFGDFYELVSQNNNLSPWPVISQQDPAAILYSSGTTGMSKGALLTHRNFIASVELFVRFEASQYDAVSSQNVSLAALPMFHIYGLSLFVMGLLSLGSTIVVMGKFEIGEAGKAIGRYGVTHFPVVPPMLIALTRAAKGGGGACWDSLKQVSCGAAPLSRKIIKEFLKALPHVDFIQGYGMTESTAVGTRGFNTEKMKKYSSVGLLAPNMEAKVMDWNTGCCMPPGNTGELWLRGPGIMKGYLNNTEATATTIDKDGWLHTGDVVYFDVDGYLYLCDRLKEIIKYKGFQIAPADLEAVLTSHPQILDAAVTAGMDEESGEVPVAFVVPRNQSLLSRKAVIDYVAEKVAPYKKVRRVIFTNSIPRSAAGKILRRELREFRTCKL